MPKPYPPYDVGKPNTSACFVSLGEAEPSARYGRTRATIRAPAMEGLSETKLRRERIVIKGGT